MLSWKDITIGQFIESHEVYQADYPEPLDREVALLSALSGQSEDEILRMRRSDFVEAIKELSFLSDLSTISTKWPKYFIIKRRVFKPVQNLQKLTAGQYIDLMSFSKDPMPNLHKILATLCLPVKYFRAQKYDGAKHGELSKFFHDNLTMDIAYPIAVFFCNLWEASMPHILTYLEKETGTLMREIQNLTQNPKTPSLNSSDGYTPLTSLPGETVQNGNSTQA
jgi:hypothetical protein